MQLNPPLKKHNFWLLIYFYEKVYQAFLLFCTTYKRYFINPSVRRIEFIFQRLHSNFLPRNEFVLSLIHPILFPALSQGEFMAYFPFVFVHPERSCAASRSARDCASCPLVIDFGNLNWFHKIRLFLRLHSDSLRNNSLMRRRKIELDARETTALGLLKKVLQWHDFTTTISLFYFFDLQTVKN